MKNIEFLLPGVPAPIGGFKVIYQHARVLKKAGYSVNVQHINPSLFNSNFFRKSLSYINFLRRKYFDIWKNYPKEYDLSFSTSNKVIIKDQQTLWVVASWQLLEQITKNNNFNNENLVHICQDFPNYMGPDNKVRESWRHDIPYISISKHLCEEILNENPKAKIHYLPSIAGETVSRIKKNKKEKFFCVVSSGLYKNQDNLIKLLNKLSQEYVVETFSRERKPPSLNNSIRHFQNLSDSDIEMLYAESKYSICYSSFEGFGLPGFDAMRNACISFTTDNLGNRDYIKPGSNCVLLDGQDINKDFKKIVGTIEKNLNLKIMIGENGQKDCENILEKFDKNYIVNIYDKLISKLFF